MIPNRTILSRSKPSRRWFRVLLAGLPLLLLGLSGPRLASPVRAASIVKPWVPPSQDSLVAWASEAKARFRTNEGDSIGGSNYRAYDLVGRAGRRLLRSLGREHLLQAHAIEPVLDSLGLDTSVAIDPTLPNFVLLVVRNVHHPSAMAVGFLYWFRGDDLRTQGVMLSGGLEPKARAWWTSRSAAPYEWGILYRERGEEARQHLLLLRLNEDGYFWNLVQYQENDPDFGSPGDADWVDLNRDGQPEIVAWSHAKFDSSFSECAGCPHLINERIFTERIPGFDLHDSRLVPSPYSTFVTFIRLLREQNREAGRLLENPAKLEEALALGWGTKAPGAKWRLEYSEPNEVWPHWLAIRHEGPKGPSEYIVHFTMKDARWIIKDWAPVAKSGRAGGSGGSGAR